MTRTMMESGGLEEAEAEAVVGRSRVLEAFVASVYGGELRPMYDPIGDVDIPGYGPVDVKSVPNPRARFVNGGRKRPRTLAVITSARPRLVLGLVEVEQWELGLPEVPGRTPQRCWHVRRADCFPPPASWVRIGCVDPDWYARTDDELLQEDWRGRNARRRLRQLARPEPLWGVDTNANGVGLAGRKGHAPGKDNWRRAR